MSINATLFVQMIVFLILVGFTMKFVWPPIMKALDERAKKIADGLSAADKAKAELANANKRVEEQLQTARNDATQRLADAERLAQSMVEEAKSRATEEGAKIIAAAKAEAEQESIKARETLRDQVAALAVKGAEQILARKSTPAFTPSCCRNSRPSCNRMAELATLARPYAEALFQVAEKGDLKQASAEVDALASVAANAQLRQFADAPKASAKQVFDVITGVRQRAAERRVEEPAAHRDRQRPPGACCPRSRRSSMRWSRERSGVSDAMVYSAFPIEPAALADVVAVAGEALQAQAQRHRAGAARADRRHPRRRRRRSARHLGQGTPRTNEGGAHGLMARERRPPDLLEPETVMKLNPAEISELIKSRIEGLGAATDIRNQGTVVS